MFFLFCVVFCGFRATNFVSISFYSRHPIGYNILMIVPVCIIFMTSSAIQQMSTLILAVTSINNESTRMLCENFHIKEKVLLLPTTHSNKLYNVCNLHDI